MPLVLQGSGGSALTLQIFLCLDDSVSGVVFGIVRLIGSVIGDTANYFLDLSCLIALVLAPIVVCLHTRKHAGIPVRW
jgi:hypothetical protein